MSLRSRLTHTVSVRTYSSSGAAGDIYAAAKSVPAFVEDVQQYTVTQDGPQVISVSMVYAEVAHAPDFAPGSLVTVWPGTSQARVARVITVERHDTGLRRPFDHVAVSLGA